MTGIDWLAVACLLSLVVIVCVLDRLRELDRRQAQAEADRQLRRELRRQR